MSRSNPTDTAAKNPARKFLKWKSGKSQWVYWDKEAEKEVLVPTKTPFIVLDILSTVTGFNDRKKQGIWSNEVRSLKTDLRVQDKDGEVFTGPWKEVKEKVHYAKFCSSVYAVAKFGDAYEMVNFQLSGASLGPWIDFVTELGGNDKLYEDLVVSISKVNDGQKGSVNYTFPTFKVVSHELSEAAQKEAEDADKVLQGYLKGYFEASPEGKASAAHSKDMEAYKAPEPSPEPSLPDEDLEDLPF